MPNSRITFGSPPLDEVTIGRQFLQRPDFLIPHFGTFWERVKEELPNVAHAPTIFDPSGGPVSEEFGFLPRVWLLTQDETRLVQLQQDRFHYNWRQRGKLNTYMRFENLLADAQKYWAVLEALIQETTGKPLQPTRAELTYVNFLEIEGVDSAATVMERSFNNFGWRASGKLLHEVKGAAHNVSFAVPEIDAVLTVSAMTASRAERKGVKLDLTVKGKCDNDSSFEKWAVAAHDFLVTSFVEITTPEMHKLWRLE